MTESARPTPPRQTDTDPTSGDRRLTDKEKSRQKNEPDPPNQDRRDELPDPKEVGEAG